MLRSILVKDWLVAKIEGEVVDPVGTKVHERGLITIEVSNIEASCNTQLLSSKYLRSNAAVVYGEAASATDRALESALAFLNENEEAVVIIEMQGRFIHETLADVKVSLCCHCCMKIISNGKSSYQYLPEEVIDIGKRYKTLGSELISTSVQHPSYSTLLSSFCLLERGVRWLELVHIEEFRKELKDLYILLKRQCYNNIAFVQLRLGCFEAVEKAASYVLLEDEKNVKALYRRAVANTSLQNFDLAKADLERLLALEPSNKAAKSQMAVVDLKISKLNKEFSHAMKKFLSL